MQFQKLFLLISNVKHYYTFLLYYITSNKQVLDIKRLFIYYVLLFQAFLDPYLPFYQIVWHKIQFNIFKYQESSITQNHQRGVAIVTTKWKMNNYMWCVPRIQDIMLQPSNRIKSGAIMSLLMQLRGEQMGVLARGQETWKRNIISDLIIKWVNVFRLIKRCFYLSFSVLLITLISREPMAVRWQKIIILFSLNSFNLQSCQDPCSKIETKIDIHEIDFTIK